MGARRYAVLLGAAALAVSAEASVPEGAGPYNARFLAGGIGVATDLPAGAPIATADHPFTLSAWVKPVEAQAGTVVLIALGDPAGASRALVLADGRLAYRSDGRTIAGGKVPAGRWSHVAAVSEGGHVALYLESSEGVEVEVVHEE